MISNKKIIKPALYLFLMVQTFLYGMILSASGDSLVISSYAAILLCFLFSFTFGTEFWLVGGLLFTALADFCLVIVEPINRLGGMVFFLGAQICYGIWLHRKNPNKALLLSRIILTVAAAVITKAVLGEKSDALALVSVCYYANLIQNILSAFSRFQEQKTISIGLLLFLLCDTVIGLQVAAGTYLPIGAESALYKFLFMGFNLSWFFYLPSQICIALTASRTGLKSIFTLTEDSAR